MPSPPTLHSCWVLHEHPIPPSGLQFSSLFELYSRNVSAVPQRCCRHDGQLHFFGWVHPIRQPTPSKSHSANWCHLPIRSLTDFPISSSRVSSSSTLGIHIHCIIYCDLIVFCSGDAIAHLANVNPFFVSRCIIQHLTVMEHMLTKWAA